MLNAPNRRDVEAKSCMKDFWDTRYSESGYAYGISPNAFMRAQDAYFTPGLSALAVADGEGRNGVWLAERGLQVCAVDQSQVGLDKAQVLAAERGVSLRTECADLLQWDWPQGVYDRVLAIFIHFMPAHRRAMHEAMFAALKPGGVLLLEAFRPEQLDYKTGGPPVVEMLYTAQMLKQDFAGAEILHCEECVDTLDEGGYHRGPAALVRLVLRKPSD